jgi:hypothetical protein
MNSYNKVIVESMIFPPIKFFEWYKKHDDIKIESNEHYQKKSFRNRYIIDSPNGVLSLSIPLVKGKNNHQLITEVEISNDENWQKSHIHSIQSVYGKSPYFIYYFDTICDLIRQNENMLLKYNNVVLTGLLKILGLEVKHSFTKDYKTLHELNDCTDMRNHLTPHNYLTMADVKPYLQVFGSPEEFKSNLSILDLLFNNGPESSLYL